MEAPEPVVTGELAVVETAEMQVSTPPHADNEISAPRAEPKATPAPPAQVRPTLRSSAKASLLAAAERPLELSREPSVEPSREPSVGATVLANGLVRRLSAAASDPLAPIRRMSQVEKIAFFS